MKTRRNVLSILIILNIFTLCFGTAEAKNTPPPLSGTKYIGTGTFTQNYATLTAAFADITTNTLGGNLVLVLQSGYSSAGETFPITAPAVASTGSYTITIYPDAAGRTITGSNTTAIIDLNGSKNIIIDGRVNGTGSTKSLVIENTSTSGSTIRLINDASNNIIRYCTVKTVNTTTALAGILFSTTTGTTGNDDNTVDNCDIRDGLTTPSLGVYSLGTAGKENSGNTVSNCNIYNFLSTGGSVGAGVFVSANNTEWTITGNSLYREASLTSAASALHYGIGIFSSAGGGFTISDNYIGGSAPQCGGSPWTMPAGGLNRFISIAITASVSLAVSNIQGNTIKNFVSNSTSSTSSLPGVWNGIYINTGYVNIGTVAGNTIGSPTGTGSISVNVTGSSGIMTGIFVTGATSVVNIANNTIGSIATSSANGSKLGIAGIYCNSAAVLTINNNLIGSLTTPGSLSTNCPTTSGSTGQPIYGIGHIGTGTTLTVTNNTVANLSNIFNSSTTSGFAPVVRGIFVGGSLSTTVGTSTAIPTITGNTVYNLTNDAIYSGTGNLSAVAGIVINTGTITSNTAISRNTIYSLRSTATTSAVSVCGISYANNTVTAGYSNLIQKNNIHSLSALSSDVAALRGILINSGRDLEISNNMVRLGVDTSGASITSAYDIIGILDSNSTANYYHNSVYIGGSNVTGTSSSFAFSSTTTSNTRNFRNNIFVNARSNGTGTGVHYAAAIGGASANPAGLTMTNNLYYTPGTEGKTGRFNATDYTTLADWQTATGVDASSLSGNPNYANPGGSASSVNLHITGSSPANGTGANIGVTDDIDGQSRNITAPDIGADEFTPAGSLLRLKALLEGSYNTGSNTMVPDTVKVYLRRTTTPFTVVDSSSVLLSSAGQGIYSFAATIRDSSFYLQLKNKRTLETWSKAGVLFNADTVDYDFTTAANKAYGDNQVLKGTKYCLYTGDINQDGVIDLGDIILIDNDNANFVTGDVATDLNGDGVVDLSDLLIADNNNANFIARVTPLSSKRVINPRPVKVQQY